MAHFKLQCRDRVVAARHVVSAPVPEGTLGTVQTVLENRGGVSYVVAFDVAWLVSGPLYGVHCLPDDVGLLLRESETNDLDFE